MCGDDPCEVSLAWVVAAHVSPPLAATQIRLCVILGDVGARDVC